jgi:hypothetical protein
MMHSLPNKKHAPTCNYNVSSFPQIPACKSPFRAVVGRGLQWLMLAKAFEFSSLNIPTPIFDPCYIVFTFPIVVPSHQKTRKRTWAHKPETSSPSIRRMFRHCMRTRHRSHRSCWEAKPHHTTQHLCHKADCDSNTLRLIHTKLSSSIFFLQHHLPRSESKIRVSKNRCSADTMNCKGIQIKQTFFSPTTTPLKLWREAKLKKKKKQSLR